MMIIAVQGNLGNFHFGWYTLFN